MDFSTLISFAAEAPQATGCAFLVGVVAGVGLFYRVGWLWLLSLGCLAVGSLQLGQHLLLADAATGLTQVWQEFVEGMKQTSLLEYVAVVAGVVSVWFSKNENIWVYPTGLISTIIYVYLSFKFELIGEASVNIYYSVLSIYGWILWSRKNQADEHVLHISFSTRKQWLQQLGFFVLLYGLIYFCLVYLQEAFYPGVIPWADALASASAYTGMWLMAKKKVESWYWWIVTNVASVPLYFVKGLVFTSVYFFVLLLMAFAGLAAWKMKAEHPENSPVGA